MVQFSKKTKQRCFSQSGSKFGGGGGVKGEDDLIRAPGVLRKMQLDCRFPSSRKTWFPG